MKNITTLSLQTLILLGVAISVTGCTQQVANSFRFNPKKQTFGSQQKINTQIDLLWVVDNSASMDASQDKLRQGLAGFAQKYLKPYWDIRIGVITTDSYLANPAFNAYLTSTVGGSVGWKSNYIASRIGTFTNPAWAPSLVNGTGNFPSGVQFGQLVPVWNSNYAKLLPGNHDGPTTALCQEILPYFLNGNTQCQIRDNPANANYSTGVANCLNPGSGQTAITQCVNTVENDTVHSGNPVIYTKPPTGTPGDANWVQSVVNNFMINATTGSSGHGSERGLASVAQLLSDNETGATPFFRPNSLRGIIFVSDEDDQSMTLPSPVPGGFTAWTNYSCDQAGLVALNPSSNITGAGGICCAGGSCSYGATGTTCPSKTVDGFTYTVSICPQASSLVPVDQYKAQFDNFFNSLDGTTSTSSYFVVSIVALSGTTIQNLQAARTTTDGAVGATKMFAVDRADRYIALGNLVGNGSSALDIGASDYSPLLDSIGATIVQKKSTFTLSRQPTATEDMVVSVQHADGTSTTVPASILQIQGNSVIITDSSFVLGLAYNDLISINYLPKTMF